LWDDPFVFEHFDARARTCVALAQEEARRLGHEEIGTVHLLLGVARVDEDLLELDVERLRATVVALHGSRPARSADPMPIGAETKAALEGANRQALLRGHTIIGPADVLLALLAVGGGAARALREAGATPTAVRERAHAAAQAAGRARPAVPRGHADHAQDLRDGRPVSVTLGADAFPIGDLGTRASTLACSS
jgi:ATP-dependent Clp protease ATP-binding subunit ClpC